MDTHPSQHRSPWHAGEKLLQERAGVAERMEVMGQKVIRDHMPDQHRAFFQQLPFMIAGAVDADGRAWATLLEGKEGFVSSPDPRRLAFDLGALGLDPLDPAAAGFSTGGALGLLGIELHSRRRNRINGRLVQASPARLEVQVEHSFGNCPQYIQLRTYSRTPEGRGTRRQDGTLLDERSAAMIREADTFFVASYVEHEAGQRSVDVSHRGGRAGFVRVQGNRLTIPDYAGNLHFNTLGNFVENPRAGLLFVDFRSGDMLQLSGRAELLPDSPLLAAFEGAERLWAFDVEQVVLRPAATSLRWSFEEYAPTSLITGTWGEAEARLREQAHRQQWQRWRVSALQQESSDIRSLLLAPPADAVVPFLAGQHLPVRITLANGEVLVRTYSLSSAPSDGYLRISVKAQGKASRHLHEQVQVGDVLEVRPPLGSFVLRDDSERPVVLIGAGVGITPMIAMLRELVALGNRRVHFFQGARSLQELPFRAELDELQQRAGDLLQVHRALSAPGEGAVQGRDHDVQGRLGVALLQASLSFDDYDFYLCGPAAMTQSFYDGLRGLNVADARIHAEAFGPSTLRRHGEGSTEIPAQPPAATEPVPVHFSGSAKEARWTPQSGSLLELAESRGLNPPFSCRGGSCGSCLTPLLSGRVHYPNPPAELPAAGSVLICCAIPAQAEEGSQTLVLDL